jgi:hypothetical protein
MICVRQANRPIASPTKERTRDSAQHPQWHLLRFYAWAAPAVMIMSSQLPIGAVALHVIDIHSHILTGIDDGPETLEDAVAMAKIAAASTASFDVCAPF